MAQAVSPPGQANAKGQRGTHLGPILCWAVVFADIGTSVYYIPGILYGNVGSLAGFFVFLTMSVFVLLTLKYAEVTHRFPQGGGVVTVAAQAMNHWVGALGGMCILVDYFLTAAISCLSGILYLSVVIPAMGPFALEITMGTLALLGLLNWIGIFLYRLQEPHAIEQVWRIVHPHDSVIAAEHASRIQDINPDRIRFEVTPEGKVAHLLKRW